MYVCVCVCVRVCGGGGGGYFECEMYMVYQCLFACTAQLGH